MASPRQKGSTEGSIDEEATGWYLRLKDVGATHDERARFQRWLARDPRHAEAYERAAALWQRLEVPAQKLAQRIDYRPRRRRVRVRLQPWLAAACLLLMLGAGVVWRDPGLIDRVRADMATRTGESQTRMLADGTVLFLDFDSAVDVDVSGDRRRVNLLRGRVWLDVAADGRAFVIEGGDARVRVKGTRLGVEREGAEVEVTVEEGEVAVSGDHAKSRDDRYLRLGQHVLVQAGVPGEIRDVDPGVELAWARGLVLFDRAGVAEIARQLERTVPGRVIFDATELSGVALSGSFPVGDPDALLNALRHTHGVQADRIVGTFIWLHR